MQKHSLPNISKLIRGHFFTGLLILTPIAIVTWISMGALQFVWGLLGLLPEDLRPNVFFIDLLIVAGLVFVIVLSTSFMGWVSNQVIGRRLLDLLAQQVIQRIPVIRSIYSALDQLLRTMAGNGSQQFNRVVYVEFPRKGTWVIAFVTSTAKAKNIPEGCVNLFIPLTPNPTSGFHLIIAETELKDTFMTVEEAFKTILSLGIAK